MKQVRTSPNEANRIPVPNRVLGMDFSGGVKAGNRIWIAIGHIIENGFRLEDYYQARDLPGDSWGSH